MGEMTMAEIREVLNAHEEWEASDSLRALVEGLEAKLAAAEAKVAQCREVLREREFVGGVKGWVCPDCGDYGFTYRVDEKRVHEPHRPDCAWKRAMEDA